MIIDLHTHTLPMSPCSYLQPGQLIQRAKELGLDGICFTEHDEVWPAEKVDQLVKKYEFLVLRGMEVSTNAGHVLVFGLEEHRRGMWEIRNLRQAVDAVGGVMILAHPNRSRVDEIAPGELPVEFDALEVLNGGVSASSNTAAQNAAVRLGLKGTGGSDSHGLHEIGLCATVFDSEIKNEEDLIEALKGNGYHHQRLR